MLDYEPNIVHFCGHGGGQEGLVFEVVTGKIKLVSAEALAGLFSLFADRLDCVLLNACYSEVQAKEISRHINSVIGMSQAIGDQAAIAFAVGFYDALGADKGVDFAYKLGCSAISMQGIPEHLTPKLLTKNNITKPEKKETSQREVIQDFEFDAYISYVDKDPDSTWVWDVLLPKLEEAGLHIAVSGDSARPGVPRLIDIEQGIKQSKRTVVVLSENYLLDNMTTFESALGQSMGIQEGSYRLLPVKIMSLDAIELPVRLSMLVILELSHPRRAEREFQRLVQSLKSPLPKMGQ
jgi:hypothetical protein